ncbi:MAG: SH3 domain-containing protein [Anaerolineae bacterium]|nr:SH3 domain-containing protein [Anaerolineae bacterium]
MRQLTIILLLLVLVAACGPAPTPTPDLVATQVAIMEAAAATMTAQAPTPIPPATLAPSQTPTVGPTSSATPTSAATVVPTATDLPGATPRPATPTPAIGPSLGRFAVAGVYSDDVLNVRSAPGVSNMIVGTIPYHGRNVNVFAGVEMVDDAWWVPVRYQELNGWVNSSFLARQAGDVADELAARTAQAILAVRDHDMQQLASLVHPVKGVTFSPYTNVRPLQGAPGQADLVFSPDQVRELWTDSTEYLWGQYDGTGEPIEMTFGAYSQRFVYDVDFAQPDVIGFGETIGQGNTINNISEVFPGSTAVEYHFEGFDPQYAGMDWRSLRLVWEQVDGIWYLVAIVHDEWTI